jgi:hypothetical protein
MTTVSLRPDCARCASLCCVGLAFDRSEQFAFDKPAGEPCRNLQASGRCRIHGALAERGFSGCAAFDCHGAGQHVVQALFGGRSWRDDASLLPAMMDALRALKPVHELAGLLQAAHRLPLTPAVRARLEALQAQLLPAGGWSETDLTSGGAAAALEQARAFLPSLRAFAQADGPTVSSTAGAGG